MDEQTIRSLELYLDGSLSRDQVIAFEERLDRDAELRVELARQEQIDSALKRLIAAPGAAPAIAATVTEEPEVAGTIRPAWSHAWQRWFAVAAMVAAGMFGVWSTWHYLAGRSLDDSRVVLKATPEKYYRDQVANNLHAYYECDPTSTKFAEYFKLHLGQPLLMNADEPGFKCLGINQCNSVSPHTLAVLTKVDQTPIIVLVDQQSADDHPTVSPASGLHLHHRDIGSLTLYEVSPLDHAKVLDMFRNPDGG